MMVDDQVIIMRPAYRDPTWLKPYQERLAKANLMCGRAYSVGPLKMTAFWPKSRNLC
jgi:hypothetical protein